MIEDLSLIEVLNSCNQKTLKVSLKTGNGTFYAISPSGTSTGSYEARIISNDKLKAIFPKVRTSFIGREESDV
ncbi:MAG: hypothetical protein V1678_03855, partial [Candidatus Aenigmatarchaeota archaeon]